MEGKERKGKKRKERKGEGKERKGKERKDKELTHIRILLNTPITTKKPHACHTRNTLLQPSRLVLIRLIHQLMRLNIRIEIVGHEVIIPMIGDRIAQRGKAARVAKGVGFDGVEDASEVRVEGEGAVGVGVAEVFDVFGEVAEEEDVVRGDFAGYFDLRGD